LRRLLRDLARAIEGAGGAAYLVGGYLRDIAEGKTSGDVDLLVTGLTYRRTGELLRSIGPGTPGIRKVVAAGRHFPVHRIAVDWGKEYIDVTNARTGTRNAGRRAGSGPGGDDRAAVEDAARRDFTINALLFRIDPERGVENGFLIDPFGGIGDLRRKRIRCVGEPAERFREDPLRILRAVRRKNERPGTVLHPGTASAIRRFGPRLLPAVSPDRISVELVRSLSADPAGTVDDLRKLDLLRVLLPEAGTQDAKVAERIAGRYRLLRRSVGIRLPLPILLANLLADLPPDAAVAAARRLRLPELRRVASTLRGISRLAHPEELRFPRAETESLLLGADDPGGWIALYRAVRRIGKSPAMDLNRFIKKCCVTPFWVNGKWLDANNFPEGPERREILLRIREESLSGRIRGRADAERVAESMRNAPGGGKGI